MNTLQLYLMMDKIKILVVANHPEILGTIIRLINKNEFWNGVGVTTAKEGAIVFQENKFNLVLLGVGVDEQTETELREVFTKHDSEILCIRHFGGGSGLLFSEIKHALAGNLR